MEAYSDRTSTTYPSWEALVEAESNGWLAIALVSNERKSWPWVVGPFPTKREASSARNRMRTKWRREEKQQSENRTVQFFIRPAWKE